MAGCRSARSYYTRTTNRAKRLVITALIAVLVSGVTALNVSNANEYVSAQDPARFDERVYIVQLEQPPALSYRGKPGGLAATRPVNGQRFDPRSSNVRQYSQELTDTHDHLLQSIGAYDGKLYSYRYTFNGFAARLTAIQAQKLRSKKNVLNVWEDQVRYLSTNDSPVFLGLFDSQGGLVTDLGLKGENVVIGIIDSGISPEHASFTDSAPASRPRLCRSSWAENSLLGLWLCHRFNRRDDELVYDPPVDWNGSCEVGENFTIDSCNNKLIGARFYVDGFLESFALDPNEFISPRDADGHGTHIASTAAGNEVRAILAGTDLDRVNGIAPRARIAVYKACWLEPGQVRGSCATSDLQRAIEDAVADGVDIINYSVGNTDISISDPDDLALLAASDAGVLSVVAAGNDGPAEATILSPSGAPWVLTVGASSRTGEKFEEAMRVNAPGNLAANYATREASFTPALKDVGPITAELILVDDGDAAFGTLYDACEPLVNGSRVADKVAFLQRGSCDFEVKLRNAENAGATAALVFNNQSDLIVMSGTRDSVNIPAVMISQADGRLLFDELQNDRPVEVTLDKSLFLNLPDKGNVMASFSSRGPNLTEPDVLKPDLTAPGVNILAAQTPDVANGLRGESFQYLSGTSMSVPHVAGIAALIREAHPDWQPAAIKSALMTTARQDVVKEDGTTPADAFDMGSGHVVPNRAADPGLVYEARKEDYDAFTCGTGAPRVSEAECEQLLAAGFPGDAVGLNLPNIALSSLVSRRTITRRVTNVGEAGQYSVQVEAPPGIDVEVTPSVLSLGPGETGSYEVSVATRSADLYEWQFGALSWVDAKHTVRSPIAVRPVPFVAPLQAIASGTSGNLQFDVQFGYTGTYETIVQGLAPPFVVEQIVIADDPLNEYVFEPPDTQSVPPDIWRSAPRLIVAEDNTFLRVALFDENTDGEDDLDLYVYYCPTQNFCSLAGLSAESDSNDRVDVLFPLPGEYIIDVHGFETDGPNAIFDLFIWTVGPFDNLGNLSVAGPTEALSGQTGTVNVSWSELEFATHLGVITHSDGTEPLEVTLIEIQN
jgi:subtilisin family serine protease